MDKKFTILLTLLSISCIFFSACKKNLNSQEITNNNSYTDYTSESISNSFQKLVNESDYCVIVSVNPKEQNEFNSKEINGEYYTDVKMNSFSEYTKIYNNFPERITIIQKESAFLEETNELKKTRFYILFLNKTENEHTYYITNNKNGVIETDLNYLYPFDEALKNELDENFEAKSPHQFKKFLSWLTNEYKFSETTYETSKSTITKNTTTNPIITPDIP